MSTRRARIKAVTSLPRRRKNAPNAETKATEEALKDNYEKDAKSPSKICSAKSESTHSSSSVSKARTPVRSRRTPVITSVEKVSETEIKVPTPLLEKRATPKKPERVPVITSTVSIKAFFPTPSKKSPVTKLVSSPAQTLHTAADVNEKTLAENNELGEVEISLEPPQEHGIPSTTSGLVEQKDTQIDNTDSKDDNLIDKSQSSKPAPNVPEDLTNVSENVLDDPMDGIVPLQPETARQKPIAVLKNEIISENAEVLFDPIVPLPSPSKVRPKLRPIPRLAPLRRNSIQGSASESEDESRRAFLHLGGSATPSSTVTSVRQRHDSQASQSTVQSLPSKEMSRTRNDSICSSVSMATGSQTNATSPAKEKSKTRRQEMSRKMAAMRRRKETMKRDQLTMYDLIFYNPMSNPILPNKEDEEAKEANEKETVVDMEPEEESARDPEPQDAAPVPQIKLGPNGEIVLDEQSLVIKQSCGRAVVGVVHEGPGASGAQSRSYRRSKRTAEWAPAETVRFYRALAAIGTDFSLMEPLFPGRNRRDLKLKFKKEEKVNCAQVDKAIRSRVEWDATRLIDEFAEERKNEERKLQQKREQLMKEKNEQQMRKLAAKELRVKHSRSAKTLGNSIMPPSSRQDIDVATTADEIIAQAVKDRKRKRHVEKTAITPNSSNSAPEAKVPIPMNPTPHTPQLATLTLIKNTSNSQSPKRLPPDLASLDSEDGPIVPPNVENGSLVVLSVNDPNSPSKKMLQTYIAHGAGKLKPVALNPTLLNSVFGYMKRGTPKSIGSARSSPLLTSPSSVCAADGKAPSTPGVIHFNPSPSKKSSYSITTL